MNAATKPETTALQTIKPASGFDLSPQTFEQALTFAQYLADSEMVPKAFRGKPGDCLIAMQWGFEVGLKPLQSLQSIAVINGRPGLFGDAGKAILLAAGCIIEEDDGEVVKKHGRGRCKITRPGRPPTERTFSVEDAKTANLWNKDGPWRNYPFRQMAWRAFWFAARDAASDLLRGLAGAEEVMDMTPEPKQMGEVERVDLVDVQPFIEAAKATKTDDEAAAYWKANNGKFAKQPADHAALKEAIIAHRKAMKERNTVGSGAPDNADVTLEKVLGFLESAKTEDTLDIAREWFADLKDPEQVKAAEARYTARLAEMREVAA